MSLETCGNTSFEKPKEQILNPKFMEFCNSLDFRNQDAIKKFASLPPEIQEELFWRLKFINADHQYYMAAIQNNVNNRYLEALNDPKFQINEQL